MSNKINKHRLEQGQHHRRKALIDDRQFRGSARVVKDIPEMLKIPHDKRKIGMRAYVQHVNGSSQVYKLISEPYPIWADTTIANWQLVDEVIPPECSRTCIYIDPIKGDDAEAVNNSCYKFKTVDAAIAFALTVDVPDNRITLVFCKGVHKFLDTSVNWAYEEFDYYFAPGAIITNDNGDNHVVPFNFDNLTKEVRITGYGEFYMSSAINPNTTNDADVLFNFNGISEQAKVLLEGHIFSGNTIARFVNIKDVTIRANELHTTNTGILYNSYTKGSFKTKINNTFIHNGGKPNQLLAYDGTAAADSILTHIDLTNVTFNTNTGDETRLATLNCDTNDILYNNITFNIDKIVVPSKQTGINLIAVDNQNVKLQVNINNTVVNPDVLYFVLLVSLKSGGRFDIQYYIKHSHISNVIAGLNMDTDDSHFSLIFDMLNFLSPGEVQISMPTDKPNSSVYIKGTINANQLNLQELVNVDAIVGKLLIDSVTLRNCPIYPKLVVNTTSSYQQVHLLGTVTGYAIITDSNLIYYRNSSINRYVHQDLVIHVDATSGDDDLGNGTPTSPFRTLSRVARLIPDVVIGKVDIILSGGYYTIQGLDDFNVHIFNKYVSNGITIQGTAISVGTADLSQQDRFTYKQTGGVSILTTDMLKLNNVRIPQLKYTATEIQLDTPIGASPTVEVIRLYSNLTIENLNELRFNQRVVFKNLILTVETTDSDVADATIEIEDSIIKSTDSFNLNTIKRISASAINILGNSTSNIIYAPIGKHSIVEYTTIKYNNTVTYALDNVYPINTSIVNANYLYQLTKDVVFDDSFVGYGTVYIKDIEVLARLTTSGITFRNRHIAFNVDDTFWAMFTSQFADNYSNSVILAKRIIGISGTNYLPVHANDNNTTAQILNKIALLDIAGISKYFEKLDGIVLAPNSTIDLPLGLQPQDSNFIVKLHYFENATPSNRKWEHFISFVIETLNITKDVILTGGGGTVDINSTVHFNTNQHILRLENTTSIETIVNVEIDRYKIQGLIRIYN